MQDPPQRLIELSSPVLDAGPPLRFAAIFGSAARGRLRPDSDVDIGIWPVDDQLSLLAEGALQSRIEDAVHRAVDLVRLDSAPTLLRYYVARDGMLVVATSPVEWPRFRARAMSDWCDFQPAYDAASRTFQARLAAAANR